MIDSNPPTPPAINMADSQRAVLLVQYDHMEGQAALGANKAALLVTAYSVLAATYVVFAKDCKLFEPFDLTHAGFWFALAGLPLFAGLILAMWAVKPKTHPNLGEERDVLFFMNIAERFESSDAYWNAWLQRCREGKLDFDLAANIYGKACWLRKKFRRISLSIACAILSILLAIGAVLHAKYRNQLNCDGLGLFGQFQSALERAGADDKSG